MNFGLRFGIGQLGGRYINSYLVAYLMDTISTDDAMDRFLDNVGSNGSNNDALALASNHIYLNGTTQGVPYPVLHTLGGDIATPYTEGTHGYGDETSTITLTGNVFSIEVTVVGTQTDKPSAKIILNSAPTIATVYKVTFTGVVNSGTPIISNMNYCGTDTVVDHTVVNGTNEVVITSGGTSSTSSYFEFDGTNLFDVDISNILVQEITLPTASYLTILQADGTIKQLSSTGDVGEPIVDNDFNDGTVGDWYGWSGGSVSNVNNTLEVTAPLDDAYFYAVYDIPTIIGRRYFFSADMLSSTTTSVKIGTSIGGSDLHNGAYSGVARTDTGSFVATTTTSYFSLVSNIANVTVNFDNVLINESLPISTTYSVTDSHQFVFNHTSPLSAEDKAAIEADPNLAFRMLHGEVLPSGFSNTDVGWFSGGNEGLASGKYVQDLSVDLSAELAGDYVSDITGTATTLIEVGGTRTVRYAIDGAGTNTSRPILRFNSTLVTGKIYIVEIDMNVISGTPYLDYFVGSGVGGNRADFNATTSGKHTYIFESSGTISTGDIYFDETNGAFDVDLTISVKELIGFVKIQDYDSTCRTTLANQSDGASNLKLKRSGSGRATGTAVANTTQWEADGRTAVTNWTITAPFTITEIIDGDTYDFTSDGNRYKNTVADGTYTLPTGIWTLDEFGFDGVTPVVVRGKTSMVDAVVIP